MSKRKFHQMLEISRSESEEEIAADDDSSSMTILQPRKRRVSDVIDSIGDMDDFSSSGLQSPVTSNDDLLENDVFEQQGSGVPVTPESVDRLMPEWMMSKIDGIDPEAASEKAKSILESSTRIPVEKDSDKYNMNHVNRGKCIVFNHENFDTGLGKRSGTSQDAQKIECTFKKLGFLVEIFDDLEHSQILEKINDLSNEDHQDNDCLCIFMLTHGFDNDLICAKDVAYNVGKIWKPFTADKCKSLAGKPKLFFIQACRGKALDPGIHVTHRDTGVGMRTEVDGPDGYQLPTQADFLIAFSTPPGFLSWRNPSEGTWFIQYLCNIIDEHHEETDLERMLTMCKRKIATECASHHEDPTMSNYKQVPSITSMLLREVYFQPK